MTYSCAMFASPHEPLKDAQLRKLHAMIDKVSTPAGPRVMGNLVTTSAGLLRAFS